MNSKENFLPSGGLLTSASIRKNIGTIKKNFVPLDFWKMKPWIVSFRNSAG